MADSIAPAAASALGSAGSGRTTVQRPRRGHSVVTNYFLVILFLFGCVQFYFNIQQDVFHHQSYHIAAFQRKHFIKSNSKSRKEYLTGKRTKVGAAAIDVDAAVEKVDYTEGGGKKHILAGLSCERFGGPSDEDATEMVFWEDIPSDSLHVSPFQKPNQKQYLTFTADHAGWNNIRMSMETTMAMAVATGRILVLPPVQQMFLVGKPTSNETDQTLLKAFSFSDFFHLESFAEEHVGMKIITMKEFLEREALTGNLRDQKTGQVVFPPNNRTDYDGADHDVIANALEKYLQRVGMVPPWDPDECVAAFPATSDTKDVQAIRDMIVGIEQFPKFETFIDNPVPINGSAIDRLKEIRADRTKVCIYDEKWQNVQLLHFGGGGAQGNEGARLLVPYYAFLFFQDWKHDTWMKRFVRDHVRYIDEIQCAAARIVKELRKRSRAKGDANGDYNAYHIRRGDFLTYYPVLRRSARGIVKFSSKEMTKHGVVYIASDEKDQTFFQPFRKAFDVVMLDDFKHLLKGVNSIYYGMIDSLIASRSEIFFGCWFSTFTGYIIRLRGFHNNKRKGMGYEMGYHSSYYYALEDRKYHLQEYHPVKKSFFATEFPTAWRLIDEGIVELAEADTTKNV